MQQYWSPVRVRVRVMVRLTVFRIDTDTRPLLPVTTAEGDGFA